MSIAIDHVGIPAADPGASARFLSEILGEGGVVSNVAKVPSRWRVMSLKFAAVPAFRPIRTQVWVAAMQSATAGLLRREPLVIRPIRRPAS